MRLCGGHFWFVKEFTKLESLTCPVSGLHSYYDRDRVVALCSCPFVYPHSDPAVVAAPRFRRLFEIFCWIFAYGHPPGLNHHRLADAICLTCASSFSICGPLLHLNHNPGQRPSRRLLWNACASCRRFSSREIHFDLTLFSNPAGHTRRFVRVFGSNSTPAAVMI